MHIFEVWLEGESKPVTLEREIPSSIVPLDVARNIAERGFVAEGMFYPGRRVKEVGIKEKPKKK